MEKTLTVMFYAEPVSTFDLDIFVTLPALSFGLLTLSPGEHVLIEGIPVQFLPAYNSLVEEALENAVEHTYSQTSTWAFRVEYLLAIAVQTGREKDRLRVRLLLDEAKIDQTILMEILDRFSLKQRWLEWIR